MKVEVSNLPDDVTILQGYFVWSGINQEGQRVSGGIEYPYHFEDDPDTHDYDALKAIGMLTFAREMLLKGEMDIHAYGDEED